LARKVTTANLGAVAAEVFVHGRAVAEEEEAGVDATVEDTGIGDGGGHQHREWQ
jgi:hypothetical protein